MALSMLFIMLIKEPPGRALEEPQSFLQIVRAIPGTLRRYPLLRRVIIAQNLLGFGAIAIPFYAVYGHSRLGLPESMGGVFIWASVAGSTSASVMWAYLNDRKGPLTVLRGIAAAALLPPAAAIAIPLLLPRFAPAANLDYAFCGVFLLNGVAMSGGWMGLTNYVFELAPDDIRPLFLGLASTLSAPVILMPMIGGLLLSLIAYQTLFAISLAGGVIGIFYVYTLERPRPPAPDAAAGPRSALPSSPTARPTLD
jgi:MFS family permease